MFRIYSCIFLFNSISQYLNTVQILFYFEKIVPEKPVSFWLASGTQVCADGRHQAVNNLGTALAETKVCVTLYRLPPSGMAIKCFTEPDVSDFLDRMIKAAQGAGWC